VANSPRDQQCPDLIAQAKDYLRLETAKLCIRQQLQVVDGVLVAQPLKTFTSRRTLVLPDIYMTALKAHRTRQLEERLKAGAYWFDTGRPTARIAKGRARRWRLAPACIRAT
jgi:hypothetical protein